MLYSFGVTIISGWNYPKPMFSHVPTAEERQPFLNWCKSNGFDGIDLADTWINWYAMSDSDLREFRDQVHAAGLVVSGLNPYRSMLVKHESAARNEEKLEQSIAVCRMLGCEFLGLPISVPFPAVWKSERERAERQLRLARDRDFTDEDFAEAAGKIARLADIAAKDGIKLTIELHDDGMTDTSGSILKLLKLVDRPNIGANPDLQNLYRVPYPTEDWRQALVALAPVTNYWHVKSNSKVFVLSENRTYSLRASMRDGDIDHRWALTVLSSHGFDGWLVLESGGGDGMYTASKDRAYMADLVDNWLPLVKGGPLGRA